MRFTDAYAQPLCSPTRASLLTGKYSARHGITSASGHQPPQPAGHKFLPEAAPPTQAMLDAGEQELSGAGGIHAGRGAARRGLSDGAHRQVASRPDAAVLAGAAGIRCRVSLPSRSGTAGNLLFALRREARRRAARPGRVGTITDGPAGEYIVDRLADEAVKFIEANRDQPFFLNLWNYGVHGPWGHKEEYTQAFAAKKDPRGVQGNPIMASMLRSVDECFGRILDALDRQGLTENTIVIFNSDNGGNTHSNTPEDAKTSEKGRVAATGRLAKMGRRHSRRRTTRRCATAKARSTKAARACR